MGRLKCKDCNYLVTAESISMVSRMIGYTAECTRTGTLFNPEEIEVEPLWCPLKPEDKMEEKL